MQLSTPRSATHPDTFNPSALLPRLFDWSAARFMRPRSAAISQSRTAPATERARMHWYDYPGAELGL